MEKTTTLVLYPGFGAGHLTPMLELSKQLLRHAGGSTAALDVVVVLVQSPFEDPRLSSFADTVARATAAHPSLSFHVLASPSLPPPPTDDGEPEQQAHAHIARMFAFLRATNAPLRDFLRRTLSSSSSSSSSRRRCALVLDMFCAHALDVAAELGVPAYFFSSSGASSLAVFLALPGVRASLPGAAGFRELADDAVLPFAGVPPLKASDLPPLIRADGAACEASLGLAYRIPEARGILVNSFESLEPRAVRALRDGLCVADGRATPPVYCVGPLVSVPPAGDEDGDDCLRWMDAQPDRSVVFLCFGSMGVLPKKQLEEIAVGLERSGQRFLWVVRAPRGHTGEPDAAAAGPDLDALLPEGFVERTRGRGLVVQNWAPQVRVLRHRAAGAFVTHCGWNSTVEGVTAGLPLLCWPLYAEQGLNKVFIVEEMRLGVEVEKTTTPRGGDGDGDEEGVVVMAEEVAAKVRWVMDDSDDGGARKLRERAAAARDRVEEALKDGGPSHAALLRFLQDLDFGGQ